MVIVCHCSSTEKHPQLNYYNHDNKIIKPLGKTVQYVDPECNSVDKWDKIIDGTKQYVWGFNCPIFIKMYLPDRLFISKYFDILINILNNSGKKLRTNGKLIFGTNDLIQGKNIVKIKQSLIENIQKKISEVKILNLWEIEYIESKNFPFNLGLYSEDIKSIEINNYLLTFEKLS